MSEVKLIGTWFSPFVRRVEIALKLKGVEYEFIEQDLKNKSPLLLQHNPVHKKVPVLLHNGRAIAESTVILEYIDEVWDQGPSILPKDPYDRAMARFWVKFLDDKCGPAMWRACWSAGEEKEKATEEAIEGLKFLEEEIKGKKFFGGDKVGILDLVANFVAHWFPILQELSGLEILSEEKFPNVWKWMGEYNNDAFLKENLPDKDELIASFKKAFATGSLY